MGRSSQSELTYQFLINKTFRIFQPSVEQHRNLQNLIHQENMDWYEFFGLAVMLFWDYGLEGQSEECKQIGTRIKHAVTQDMAFYLERVKLQEQPIGRVAMLVALLPSLHVRLTIDWITVAMWGFRG